MQQGPAHPRIHPALIHQHSNMRRIELAEPHNTPRPNRDLLDALKRSTRDLSRVGMCEVEQISGKHFHQAVGVLRSICGVD
jgi:hypothetical protein